MISNSSLILIVDDDAAVCWALRQALTHDGFTVAVAATIARARTLAHRQRPALVITDLRMTGGDGLDLLSIFRRELPGVPVVLTTAYGSLNVAVQASERGAFGVAFPTLGRLYGSSAWHLPSVCASGGPP